MREQNRKSKSGNTNGYFVVNTPSGSGQNIFIVKDKKIYTNDVNASILLGVTRKTIIQLCNNLNYLVEKLEINIKDNIIIIYCNCK